METPEKKTSGGGIVLNKEGKVLLVAQPKYGFSWSLPKGKLEEGEDLLTAAMREIEEESGVTQLELLQKEELGNYERYRISKDGKGEDKSVLKRIHIFLFKTTQDKFSPKDPKNPEARWVDREEVADFFTHPKDKAFFLSIIDKLP